MIDPSVHLRKSLMNKEFMETAKIKGLVTICWTLGDSPVFSGIHLEVENVSYGTKCKLFSYLHGSYPGIGKARDIYTLQNKRFVSPFYRFNISCTPNEISKLRTYIESRQSPFGFTCSLTTCSILRLNTSHKISPIFSLTPVLTACYLAVNKYLNTGLVDRVTYLGRDVPIYFPGPYAELLMSAFAIYAIFEIVILLRI